MCLPPCCLLSLNQQSLLSITIWQPVNYCLRPDVSQRIPLYSPRSKSCTRVLCSESVLQNSTFQTFGYNFSARNECGHNLTSRQQFKIMTPLRISWSTADVSSPVLQFCTLSIWNIHFSSTVTGRISVGFFLHTRFPRTDFARV
jgi:hypothetical protein